MKFKPIALVALACLLALTACLSATRPTVPLPTPGAPVFDTLIVPGVRIGPIALGATAGDLLAALGRPDHQLDTLNFWQLGGGNLASGIQAYLPNDLLQAAYVVTQDPRYATAAGVRVGSAELEMRAHYGQPRTTITKQSGIKIVHQYCYSTGITFIVGDGTVWVINIDPPGSQC